MMSKGFLSMHKKVILTNPVRIQYVILFIISAIIIPALLEADGLRYNPWSYPDNRQVPAGNRPWANMPPGQPSRQYYRWHEPGVGQRYNQPAYPYHGYMRSPYSDPYYGYKSPYNSYMLPGFGGMNGIYPGIQGGSMVPGAMYSYPGW